MTSLPTKIVCVGKNFVAHAAELGSSVPSEPLLFFKPPSSIIAAGEPIVIPNGVGRYFRETIGASLEMPGMDVPHYRWYDGVK